MPTIDTIDPFFRAYTDEYIKYLQHLELPIQYQLPKPPWYKKYRDFRSRRPPQYDHALDNFLHFPRKDKEISEQTKLLKEQGIVPKRTICPAAEEELIMQTKTKDCGRYWFMGIISLYNDDIMQVSEIIQQNTGRELTDYVLEVKNNNKLKTYNLLLGNIVSFQARLHQITSGYINYTEGINDSVITYKLNTVNNYQLIN